MNYFSDVYLARLNRYGDTLQGRIYGKMENDFKVFRDKSLNKVEVEFDGKKYDSVLQSETVNEKETIDYLLTERPVHIAAGTIFVVRQERTGELQHWMILLQEQYQTMGYNKYKVILMERQVSWIDGQIIHTSWAHQMSATGNLNSRDRAIATNFKISDNVAVDIPTKTMQLIMPKNDNFGRNSKFNLNDATWKVYGYDKESLQNVMAITLKETYTEDGELANLEQLNGWTMTTSMGEEIVSNTAGSINQNVDFFPYYNGAAASQQVEVSCSDKDLIIEKVANNCYHLLYGGEKTEFVLDAHITGTTLTLNIPVVIAAAAEYISIVGPKKIKVNEIVELDISSNILDYDVEIESEKGCFEIVSTAAASFKIKGTKIGQDNIVLTYNSESYKFPIEVLSFWM